eukprot:SAG31_NODE_1294_length_8954_cov_2.434557_3_plen_76_part_00
MEPARDAVSAAPETRKVQRMTARGLGRAAGLSPMTLGGSGVLCADPASRGRRSRLASSSLAAGWSDALRTAVVAV